MREYHWFYLHVKEVALVNAFIVYLGHGNPASSVYYMDNGMERLSTEEEVQVYGSAFTWQ